MAEELRRVGLGGYGSLHASAIVGPRSVSETSSGISDTAHDAGRHMDPSPVVLVVDDEEVVRQVVKGALLDLGHTVDLAADGAEALRCLAHRKYDVILTDLQMPQMDGLTLFRRATEAGHPGAWILMTGSARPEVELSVPLLSKPFLLDELESVFKRVVSRGTTPGVP